jgi:hypothetical protein
MKPEIRFGKPNSYDFDTLLDQFSGTKINSLRTSSIPLVQFWKNTESKINELLYEFKLTIDNPQLCFEYPTKPEMGKGKASMTDLMILCGETKIAIEAKFTEYAKMPSDLIQRWLVTNETIENKEKVLNYWTSLIKPFSNGFDNKSLQKVSYQFYHRTASACKDAKKAIVVYQLFYDNETKNKLEKYKNKLSEYMDILNPNDELSFYIWEIEAIQKLKYIKNNDPFFAMKAHNVYEFGESHLFKMK